jgi:hypothetical protein
MRAQHSNDRLDQPDRELRGMDILRRAVGTAARRYTQHVAGPGEASF